MVETLYHLCHNAYLLGDREGARKYFELIKSEYRDGAPKDSLDREQYLRLKSIRVALETGSMPKQSWVDDLPPAPEGRDGLDGRQDDLVRRIHTEALDDLKAALGEDVRLANVEHPCPPYGRADMLYMSDGTAFPVEVKRKDGGHDVVGQIAKYALYMRLRLMLHHYRRVRPVTICAGYAPYAHRELKAQSVETLVYTESDGRIKVVAV